MPQLVENIDFYYNENGLLVLTEHYLLNRGYCCGNGCKHCPYEYENVSLEKRQALFNKRLMEKENHDKK